MCSAIENKVFCFAALADSTKGTIYNNLTGQIPVQSYMGNQYIFIAYIHDESYIFVHPIKSRMDVSVIVIFKEVYLHLHE